MRDARGVRLRDDRRRRCRRWTGSRTRSTSPGLRRRSRSARSRPSRIAGTRRRRRVQRVAEDVDRPVGARVAAVAEQHHDAPRVGARSGPSTTSPRLLRRRCDAGREAADARARRAREGDDHARPSGPLPSSSSVPCSRDLVRVARCTAAAGTQLALVMRTAVHVRARAAARRRSAGARRLARRVGRPPGAVPPALARRRGRARARSERAQQQPPATAAARNLDRLWARVLANVDPSRRTARIAPGVAARSAAVGRYPLCSCKPSHGDTEVAPCAALSPSGSPTAAGAGGERARGQPGRRVGQVEARWARRRWGRRRETARRGTGSGPARRPSSNWPPP